MKNGLTGHFKNNPELLEPVDDIIQDQLKEGNMIEEVDPTIECNGPVCYMPHRPVVNKSAKSTKVQIVYDASAQESSDAASLNQCVEVGPPLQNQLWDVIVRNFHYSKAVLRRNFHYSKAILTVKLPLFKGNCYGKISSIQRQFLRRVVLRFMWRKHAQGLQIWRIS